jgi:hypothetical protein
MLASHKQEMSILRLAATVRSLQRPRPTSGAAGSGSGTDAIRRRLHAIVEQSWQRYL